MPQAEVGPAIDACSAVERGWRFSLLSSANPLAPHGLRLKSVAGNAHRLSNLLAPSVAPRWQPRGAAAEVAAATSMSREMASGGSAATATAAAAQL